MERFEILYPLEDRETREFCYLIPSLLPAEKPGKKETEAKRATEEGAERKERERNEEQKEEKGELRKWNELKEEENDQERKGGGERG